jgi:hypothetical protein
MESARVAVARLVASMAPRMERLDWTARPEGSMRIAGAAG